MAGSNPRFLNGVPECCCCDYVFYGPTGNAAPISLSGCSIMYINQNKSNRWKRMAGTDGLPILSGSSPTCLDQINGQVFTTHGFQGLPSGVTIARTDIEQAIKEHFEGKTTWPQHLVYFQPASPGSITYFIMSMALDKRNGVILFVQRKLVNGPPQVVTFEVRQVPYAGGASTLVTTLTGINALGKTGTSAWHPGLMALYVNAETDGTGGDHHIKLVTALGDTNIYTVARSTSAHLWGLSLDLERAKLWWLEFNNNSLTAPGGIQTIKCSDLGGGGVTTVATFPGEFVNTIRRSYKKNKMIIYKRTPGTTAVQDPGNGLFIADYDFSNLELIYEAAQGFNEGTGQSQPFGDGLQLELHCGWEFTGSAYPGA